MRSTTFSTRLFVPIIIAITSFAAGYYLAKQSFKSTKASGEGAVLQKVSSKDGASPEERKPLCPWTQTENASADTVDDSNPSDSVESSVSNHTEPCWKDQSQDRAYMPDESDGDDPDRAESEPNDDMAPFYDVQAALNIDNLTKIALNQRHLIEECPQELSCSIISEPTCGSYNVVYFLTFSDGIEWVARVPGDGHIFQEIDREKMEASYSTMRYIKSKTRIPMPTVHYWSTENEEIGSAFALLSYTKGVRVCDLWFDKSWNTETRRLKILDNIAALIPQLYSLQFHNIGMLKFNSIGQPTAVGPIIRYLHSYERESNWAERDISGPHNDMRSWLKRPVDSIELDDLNDQHHYDRPSLRMLFDSIPEYMRATPFTLAHGDLDWQNILVDKDTCELAGIIDWDDVKVEPASTGCCGYPVWLTRDWDPMEFESRRDSDHDGIRDLTPEHLSRYRQYYIARLQTHLRNETSYDPRWTKYNHILDAIRRSREDTVASQYIPRLLLHHAFRGELDFDTPTHYKSWGTKLYDSINARIKDKVSKMWYAEWECPPDEDENYNVQHWYLKWYIEHEEDIGTTTFEQADEHEEIGEEEQGDKTVETTHGAT